jgi:Outer membrane protein Omp28/Secretion system C-terminal sorting domain
MPDRGDRYIHRPLTRSRTGTKPTRMKKTLTLLGFIPVFASAQSLVNMTPENRTAFLEEFTGVNCGYCPEGHAIAANLEATLKDRFVTISVHAGGYAVPSGGQPDFRTDDGEAIDAAFTVGGYPAGTVNRHTVDGEDDLDRGQWEGVANDMLALPSPVNVGVESSFDDATNELTVHVVAYYTDASAAGNDRLSVLVKENHIVGYQADYTNGTQPNYDHMAVLRDHITETWGEDIGSPLPGETVERTYTYTVPEEWVPGNCQVVAFVGEYQEEVYQAREVAMVGGTTLIIGSLAGDPTPYRPGQNGNNTLFSGSFANALNADETYVVTLTSYGSPVTWVSGFTVNGTDIGNPGTVLVTNGSTANVDVQITPDGTPGIGNYTLSIASQTNSGAPILETVYHVISGVQDLIVTHPGAEAHEVIYTDAIWYQPAKAQTTKNDFTAFGLANALVDVNNLYLNVSWTFPSLTDDEVEVLAAFMDAGGNLMIAGQDIGWDQSGTTGSYGTPATQAFYTDYMLADFVDDGSTADNSVNFEDADAVFGTVPNSAINSVFGTNSYPERITPIEPAVPILRYNSPTKIGGLRAETPTHKLVYFGVGPEQMTNAAVGLAMVNLSHDWFYGIVGTEEFDAAMAQLGRPYPSPAADVVNIDVSGVDDASTLEVLDAAGRLVASQAIANNAAIAALDVTGLSNGLYTVRARGANGAGQARVFEVLR